MCRERKRTRVLVSETTNPQVTEVIKTYCHGRQAVVEMVPARDGSTDLEALKSMLDDTVACFYVQQPNFYGILEDGGHAPRPSMKGAGSSSWAAIPLQLAIVETPGECGAVWRWGKGSRWACRYLRAALIWALWQLPGI